MSDKEYIENIKNISSEELIEELRYYGTDSYYQDLWDCTLNEIKRRLCKKHAEEIVRCKECRYCKKKRGTFKGEPIIFYRCEENNRDVESDDFCSWAEREGEWERKSDE